MLFGFRGLVGPINTKRKDSRCENSSEQCVHCICTWEWNRTVCNVKLHLCCWGSGAELYKDKCCIKNGEMTEERFSVESDFQWRRRIMLLLCPNTYAQMKRVKSLVLSFREEGS